MKSLLGKYKAALYRMHGWRVELTCERCGTRRLPRYEGWMQNIAQGAGGKPTIYAKLTCAGCGNRLTDEAGRKLAELFSNLSPPAENGKIMLQFIAGLIIVPMAFAFLVFIGIQMGWWGYSALAVLVLSAILIPPLVMIKNYRIAMIRSRCACGKPDYLFMGQMDNTACFRCTSCGRLLRLRD